ncbi:hypothetical protein GH714_013095 [Hevea brasiliensis]|uniref:Uncharacterized protein n=1 Tax=Hevea brasiliensis TaxID=3981 RepID=A0A6A6MKD4_HEVBR|nr:hypothetical protein GH714_013095 [Hevea brasiliensis]
MQQVWLGRTGERESCLLVVEEEIHEEGGSEVVTAGGGAIGVDGGGDVGGAGGGDAGGDGGGADGSGVEGVVVDGRVDDGGGKVDVEFDGKEGAVVDDGEVAEDVVGGTAEGEEFGEGDVEAMSVSNKMYEKLYLHIKF